MAFCPVCRSEFRPGFERCEECDQALVASLPAQRRDPPERLVCVFQTADPPDALLARSVLEGHGMDTALENEHAASLVIGMPISAVPLRVSVREQDASEAAEILKSLRTIPPPTVERRRTSARGWLLGTALVTVTFIGSEEVAADASFAWGVLSLGVLFYLRGGSIELGFSGARMALFMFLGAVVSVGAVLLAGELFPFRPYDRESGRHILMWAAVEEAAKFAPVLVIFMLKPDGFRHGFAWVLAGFASGVGFGFTESLLKVRALGEETLVGVMSSFLHPMLTALVGYCVASRMGVIGGTLAGWVVASLIHAIWNSLAFSESSWICVVTLPIAGWVYWLAIQNWRTEFDSPASGNSEPN